MAEEPHSTATLVGEAVDQVQNIIRSEMRLAAAEMKDKAREAAKAGSLVAGGAGLAACGGAFLLVFTYKLLSKATGRPWLAALSMTLGLEALAALTTQRGLEKLAGVKEKI